MANGYKLDKGFLFDHTWEKQFRKLSPDAFHRTFWELYDYQRNGIQVPEHEDPLEDCIVSFVVPQIQNRLNGAKAGGTPPPNLSPEAGGTPLKLSQDKLKQDKVSYTPSGGVGDEGFEKFWSIYPKKTGKDAAREVYRALSVTDVNELCQLVERWKSSAEWKRDGGRYIKQPAKFLTEIFAERVNPPDYNEDADGFWNEAVEAELRRRIM